jgi:hypothetical protein
VAAYRVQIFNEVIHAIVTNPTRLLSTVFLGAISLWAFMLLGIAFFWGDYSLDDSSWNDVCYSFQSCFGCVTLRVQRVSVISAMSGVSATVRVLLSTPRPESIVPSQLDSQGSLCVEEAWSFAAHECFLHFVVRYHVRMGMGSAPAFSQPSPNPGGVVFNFAYTFVGLLGLFVADKLRLHCTLVSVGSSCRYCGVGLDLCRRSCCGSLWPLLGEAVCMPGTWVAVSHTVAGRCVLPRVCSLTPCCALRCTVALGPCSPCDFALTSGTIIDNLGSLRGRCS